MTFYPPMQNANILAAMWKKVDIDKYIMTTHRTEYIPECSKK